MLRHNRVDLQKVYRERVKPELSREEAAAMERAMAAKPFRALFTAVADKIHWYLLDAPASTTGKRFGVARSWCEAEEAVRNLLNPTAKHRGLTV